MVLQKIKTLFWLPTIIVDLYQAHLSPKWLFAATYKPSTEGQREAETNIRNAARLAAYKAKRLIDNGNS